jgi:endonuclease/exonuclease/phosphatase (EEP) superfamily protein YafD
LKSSILVISRLFQAALFAVFMTTGLPTHAVRCVDAMGVSAERPSDAVADTPVAALSHFGASRALRNSIGERFKLLVWNVYKGRKPLLAKDYEKLGKDADIVLFQEAKSDTDWTSEIHNANPELQWTMAHAFTMRSGFETGVATGARFSNFRAEALLTTAREPLLRTPKSMLVTEYALAGRTDTLLVVNVHAINFVLSSSFESQMLQLEEAIARHRGPIVVAGDFNTWKKSRMDLLIISLGRHGVVLAPAAGKSRIALDHIFSRGLRILRTPKVERVKSSDHQPLLIEFEVPQFTNLD